MQSGQEPIDPWNSSAPYWERHRDIITLMFAPVTEALVEAARIGANQTILDVGTGPGEPALSIAALVGPQGKVCGIDPAPGMVAAARRAAGRAQLPNAQFDVAFANHLPFASDTFDAVISRFGAMFFQPPVDGLREMLRVLKPGQTLAMAVWHTAETNLFLSTPSTVIDRYIEPTPAEPDAPDAFRFAGPGKLRDILIAAGATETAERLLRFQMEVPLALEDVWPLRCEMSEKLREKTALLTPDHLAQVRDQVLNAYRVYATDRGMSFPAEVLIISGTKA